MALTEHNPGARAGGGNMSALTDMVVVAKGALKRGDLIMAAGIMLIVVGLILPLPPMLLDMMLGLNVTISILILMVVLFIEKPLELSSYPTILLITTLLRLSLNMASTRLILTQGHEGTSAAGHVIEAFAGFVMGGDFIIGVIVYAILTIVNFKVITAGSGRIAEVAARFTLDAMPGKQMAIDADLSAGMIDETTARAKRKELEDESAFFGSMDGASKFVKGDAVAGLMIMFINIIGGVSLAVLRYDMPILQALDTFTKLTIGDGLVSQIPALVISISAGFLVSKAGTGGSTDKAVVGQLTNHISALGLSAGAMTLLALMPGMPVLPFLPVIAAIGAAAWYLPKLRAKKEAEEAEAAAAEAAGMGGPGGGAAPMADEPIATALAIDLIRLELGYGLLSLINQPQAGSHRLTDQIKGLRRQIAGEVGFVMPAVRIQDNLQLPPNAYIIRVKEIEAGRGDIRPNMLLVMDPRGEAMSLPGEQTVEPTFGLPAIWIEPGYREEALFKGYTVVDPSTVITTHLTELIKDNMPELLSFTETQKLLDELDKEHQKLIADVVPAQITVGGLQRVLQNLLAERVSVRDLATILEGVSEAASQTRSITQITEHVRTRLARQICDANINEMGVIPLVTLSPEWEQAFAESLVGDGDDRQLTMAPSRLQQFITSVRQTFERHAMMGETPVLLTSPLIRPFVRSIVERFRPATVVMSQNEIHPKARIKTLGQI
ncbi:flagellar biosynthesis protein FlhA [Azospirillum brasilense]|uniref:Flagellar biosynthesis protein FlhA n=1 Tax=Azospirillum brasilense TaxID=192 RepID=A0A0P0ET90_AZOBR|nr:MULTISPECIES: flagellar biosynthesis protein FlhA [Azospirillum]ALJ37623.1 flagellar biosynthesis protein FlhA [Azospirillum brasilense]MDW7553834.1 flagellar biosynthesis protein FlhA [Azospirillum brasilense]MDW7592727.1 flagellar biosynthesis protein FlhA [Azospirillum brasilense]MDW7628258.1 flagellar biosynthesis protein FlhA [Azospirillum brasilense]MDX5952197.1 flagellar biosynthesis protein FlhA [Azospirillum brasilense]